MKIALCVGHSRRGDSGAISADDETTEHGFWSGVAYLIKNSIPPIDHDVRVFEHYKGRSYTEAMNYISDELRGYGAELAIELHYNAYNTRACGFEALHWHSSSKGERVAECLVAAQQQLAPDFTNRGVKAITSRGRGSQFLRKTSCPAVIWEPFFGDNPEEWEYYSTNEHLLCDIVGLALDYEGGVK